MKEPGIQTLTRWLFGDIILPSSWSLIFLASTQCLQSIGPSCSEQMSMFIAALFTTAKTWKQPKCPLTDEWIKKMQHLYTMDYYSAIKQNEIMSFTATRMGLEIFILSKVKSDKDKYHTSVICRIFKNDTNELICKTEVDSQT